MYEKKYFLINEAFWTALNLGCPGLKQNSSVATMMNVRSILFIGVLTSTQVLLTFYTIKPLNRDEDISRTFRSIAFQQKYQNNNYVEHILYKGDKEIELTKKEILFLELFSHNLHHIATYEEIEEYVWEGDSTSLVNIRAMIKRLRKKIPNESIVIVKGMGYSLNKSCYLE